VESEQSKDPSNINSSEYNPKLSEAVHDTGRTSFKYKFVSESGSMVIVGASVSSIAYVKLIRNKNIINNIIFFILS
jgi:hypothetical protein